MAKAQATIDAWRGGAPILWERLAAVIDLRRWLAAAMTTTLILVATIVAWRAAGGSLLYPLSVSSLAMLALALGGMATVAHRGGCVGSIERRWRSMRSYLISAAVVVLAIVFSRPGTHAAGLFILWAVLLSEEGWAWWPGKQGASGTSEPAVETPIAPTTDSPPAEVFQQLIFRQTAGGQELSGWLRMPWVPGQRSGSLHVAFCPPFSAPPEIDVELCEGPDAAIHVAQRLSYGMRLDLKRSAAADASAATLIQFVARSEGIGETEARMAEKE